MIILPAAGLAVCCNNISRLLTIRLFCPILTTQVQLKDFIVVLFTLILYAEEFVSKVLCIPKVSLSHESAESLKVKELFLHRSIIIGDIAGELYFLVKIYTNLFRKEIKDVKSILDKV